MVQVRISTVAGRTTIVADSNDTPKEILDANDVLYEGAIISVDGFPLNLTDFNTSLSELGVVDECNITVVIKTGNA